MIWRRLRKHGPATELHAQPITAHEPVERIPETLGGAPWAPPTDLDPGYLQAYERGYAEGRFARVFVERAVPPATPDLNALHRDLAEALPIAGQASAGWSSWGNQLADAAMSVLRLHGLIPASRQMPPPEARG